MTTAFVLKANRYVISYRVDGLLSQTAFSSFVIGSETKGSGEMQYNSFVQSPPDFGNFTVRLIKAHERRELHTMASH